MDTVIFYSAILLLLAAIAAGWLMTLLGLPGNWLMVASAGVYAWLSPATNSANLSWQSIVLLAVVAGLGELAEFAASFWGAKRAGGSRRAALLAIVGSLIGAVCGAFVGIPIPIVGPLLAAVLGGALGALVGAAIGEHSLGESPGQSWRVGHAAFWGRVLGTGAKIVAATIIAVAILVALIT